MTSCVEEETKRGHTYTHPSNHNQPKFPAIYNAAIYNTTAAVAPPYIWVVSLRTSIPRLMGFAFAPTTSSPPRSGLGTLGFMAMRGLYIRVR